MITTVFQDGLDNIHSPVDGVVAKLKRDPLNWLQRQHNLLLL